MAKSKKKTALIKRELMKIAAETEIDLDFVAAVAGDREPSPEDAGAIERVREKRGESFFADLIFAAVKQRFPPAEAEVVWRAVLRHKYEVSETLGRNVGICVALHDYLSNVLDRLPAAGVVPEEKLDDIAEVAVTDGLTALLDRPTFDTGLHIEMQRHRRYGTKVSLIMLDIDDFKHFNDTQGHQKGDEILTRLGGLIDKVVRVTDLAARNGGEEFAIILPHTGIEESRETAERLRATVEREFASDGVTVSLGVANCPEHADESRTLIKAADQALYEAKDRGKNQVVVANEGV